jgi:hypothetical protein
MRTEVILAAVTHTGAQVWIRRPLAIVPRALIATLTVALWLIASAAIVHGVQGGAGADRQATPGQAATGEVISERGGVLRLDTTPCRDGASILIFRNNYVKESAGGVNCKGARRMLVQVVQR